MCGNTPGKGYEPLNKEASSSAGLIPETDLEFWEDDLWFLDGHHDT